MMMMMVGQLQLRVFNLLALAIRNAIRGHHKDIFLVAIDPEKIYCSYLWDQIFKYLLTYFKSERVEP